MGCLKYSNLETEEIIELSSFYSLGRLLDDKKQVRSILFFSKDQKQGVKIFPQKPELTTGEFYQEQGGIISKLNIEEILKTSIDKNTQEYKLLTLIEKEVDKLVHIAKKYKFQTGFIELALFDPKDDTGNRFYSLMIGSNSKSIGKYLHEIGANFNSQESEEEVKENRGTIILNHDFYNSTHFHYQYDSEIRCEQIDKDNKYIYFGCYEGENNQENFNKLKKNIEQFLITAVNFHDQEGSLKINHSIVIPIFRPAGITLDNASNNNNQKLFLQRYRGGGLFFYGQFLSDEIKIINDFILKFRTLADQAVISQSFTQMDVELYRYKARSTILHHVPYVISEVIEYLNEYQKTHDDFSIPVTLYNIAMDSTLYSKGTRKDEFFKSVVRLPNVEKIFRKKGIGDEFFQELVGEGKISRKLAEARLQNGRFPIFKSKLNKPQIIVKGNLLASQTNLSDINSIELSILIGALIILFKEAIEHTERYIRDFCPQDEEKKVISVLVTENTIVVKNPCEAHDANIVSIESGSRQAEALRLYNNNLIGWEIYNPEVKDGFWCRCLGKIKNQDNFTKKI